MDLHFENRLEVKVTSVSNEFIDEYMAKANGEYVKVYLYLLRHSREAVTVISIADSLNHTEADVRRALCYWQKTGVLSLSEGAENVRSGENKSQNVEIAGEGPADWRSAARQEAAEGRELAAARQEAAEGRGFAAARQEAAEGRGLAAARQEMAEGREFAAARQEAAEGRELAAARQESAEGREFAAARQESAARQKQEVKTEVREAADGQEAAFVRGSAVKEATRAHCTSREIEALSGDGEFSQLIYIAQKYMNKVFTPKDCEVFAYLYGTLHMPAELLEYLVEYCAQNNHTSIRYIETVALNWHEKKLLTVEEAQAYAKSFSKDSFAVMKAFGLTGRKPGEKEFEDIERWFKTYGFTKEIVIEACNRTMEAIHTPSFQYAEQILKDWKRSGVRTQRDIEEMDKKRHEQKSYEQKDKAAKSQNRKNSAGKAANRFHNLEEHGYDYDKMVWNMIQSNQSGE